MNAFAHPTFVHGDCHAHQFYLCQWDGHWTVSGVLDMEVASAGDCGEHFLKICAEMSRRYGVGTEWWQPLFDGYGGEPDFDLLKLRYLASAQLELSPHPYTSVPGLRELAVKNILKARDWRGLFDLRDMKERHNKTNPGDA